MATTYTWRIETLKCAPQVGDKVNVVKSIPYDYIGVDDDGIEAIVSGDLEVADPGEDWIEYSDLTKSDVEGWLEANLDVQTLKNKIQNKIDLIKTPAVVKVVKPW